MKTLMHRYEKKFLIPLNLYKSVKFFFDKSLSKDKHHIGELPYNVETIYFDTPNFSIIKKNFEKNSYKEKIRLRTYNNTISFLELKKKFNKQSYKFRLPIDKLCYDKLINNDYSFLSESFHEKNFSQKLSNSLKPSAIVKYNRYAYEKTNIGLRVTIDSNLKYKFLNGDENHLFKGYSILEIKCHGAFPLWLVRFLSENNFYSQSLSKYARSYEIMKKGESNVKFN